VVYLELWSDCQAPRTTYKDRCPLPFWQGMLGGI
jgi:hypothetical protein